MTVPVPVAVTLNDGAVPPAHTALGLETLAVIAVFAFIVTSATALVTSVPQLLCAIT